MTTEMGGSSFYPGDDGSLFPINGLRFGVLICYEGMFYRLSSDYAAANADFLVNITNDGWSRSYAGHFQHFAAAKFRSVENGITFLRAGNTGFTSVIDPFGRTVKSIPILKKGYLVADINSGARIRTIYSRVGDLFSYIVIIFIAILLIRSIIIGIMSKKGKGVVS
jgi:apolipoprotein N-acyltransferase